jgi:hypothetical protein
MKQDEPLSPSKGKRVPERAWKSFDKAIIPVNIYSSVWDLWECTPLILNSSNQTTSKGNKSLSTEC